MKKRKILIKMYLHIGWPMDLLYSFYFIIIIYIIIMNKQKIQTQTYIMLMIKGVHSWGNYIYLFRKYPKEIFLEFATLIKF